MRSPPGAFAGLGEVRGGACCDGGGFPWRRSPERGFWWFWGSGSSAKGPESLRKVLANRCRVRAGHPPRRSHGVRGDGAPAHIVPVVRVAYGLNNLAQRIVDNGVVLTEV